MKRIRDVIVLLALALVAARPAATASAADPSQPPLNQTLVLEGGESSNLREYDPATTHGSGDKLVFSGLVALDPRLNLIPDLASDWQVSPDGTTYQFTLRSTAKFHDGRAVTSQDVIYSFERAADPKTQSSSVMTYLGDIVGVKEMHSGQADHISGLKAVDEHRLGGRRPRGAAALGGGLSHGSPR